MCTLDGGLWFAVNIGDSSERELTTLLLYAIFSDSRSRRWGAWQDNAGLGCRRMRKAYAEGPRQFGALPLEWSTTWSTHQRRLRGSTHVPSGSVAVGGVK